MKKALLLLLVASVLPSLSHSQETFPFVERDSTLYLDVWRPAHARSDRACVIALFGGGFVGGQRDNTYQKTIAQLLTERGFTVISCDYRLGLKDSAVVAQHSGLFSLTDLFQFCIDIAVEDCAAAVAWVCSHAADLDVDPQHIILTGSSAGAITVLQTDWCRANGSPLTAALPEGWKPAAVVPYAGAIMSHGKVSWNTPPAPTLFMHGTKDKIVAYKSFPPLLRHKLYGSSRVFDRMKKFGHPCWIVRFEGIGHEVASWLPGSVDIFCAFVNGVLAGRVSTLDATMTDKSLVPTKWTNMSLRELYGK